MHRLLNSILKIYFLPNSVRLFALKVSKIQIGIGVSISYKMHITGNKLKIGDGTWIGYDCYFSCSDSEIKIGKNVGVASGVKFVTDTHEIGTTDKRCGKNYSKPIIVADGCWIGTGAIVLPGTVIHEGCVIAAGSIVRGECEKNCLYAGNPAQKKKCLL